MYKICRKCAAPKICRKYGKHIFDIFPDVCRQRSKHTAARIWLPRGRSTFHSVTLLSGPKICTFHESDFAFPATLRLARFLCYELIRKLIMDSWGLFFFVVPLYFSVWRRCQLGPFVIGRLAWAFNRVGGDQLMDATFSHHVWLDFGSGWNAHIDLLLGV